MMKIRKDYNLKILSAVLALVLTLGFSAYGIGPVENSCLRPPLDNRGRIVDTAKMQLLQELAQYPQEVDLMVSLGINPGDKVVDVGTMNNISIGLLTAALDGDYIGFDLQFRNREAILEKWYNKYNLSQFGGSVRHAGVDFVEYARENLGDNSVRFALGLTGVIGDPGPASNMDDVLAEMVRVVEHGGEIVLANYASQGEIERREETITNFLNSERGRNVNLIEISSGERGPKYRTYMRYRVKKLTSTAKTVSAREVFLEVSPKDQNGISLANMIDNLGISSSDNILYVGAGTVWQIAVACAIKEARIDIVQPPYYYMHGDVQQTVSLKTSIERIRPRIIEAFGSDLIGDRIDTESYPTILEEANISDARYSFVFCIDVLLDMGDSTEARGFIEKMLPLLKDKAIIIIEARTASEAILRKHAEALGYRIEIEDAPGQSRHIFYPLKMCYVTRHADGVMTISDRVRLDQPLRTDL